MALFIEQKEIENVYLNGMQLDHIYVNGVMVYESTIYVDKPTISGTYTYNGSVQSVAISGYDEEAMTIGGAYEAAEAGTYTVTFTPKKGYAWADETTAPVSCTWTIAKRTVSIPTLSATWFAWVEGNTHSVIVNGIDTNYIEQSGDLTQTDTESNIGASHTITWTLKNSASCEWTDGTNGKKTATWSTAWSNGTSHYKNDIYNLGWNGGVAAGLTSTAFNSDHIYGRSYDKGSYIGNTNKGPIIYMTSPLAIGKTIHVEFRRWDHSTTVSVEVQLYYLYMNSSGQLNGLSNLLDYANGYSLGEWGSWNSDLSYTVPSSSSRDEYPCIMTGGSSGGSFELQIRRIWLT